MATVTKRGRFWAFKEKLKVIQRKENGKNKAGVRRIFGLINSTIQTIVKTEPK